MSTDLFTPIPIGDLILPNRMVMAPMTRNRAIEGNVPNPLAATYYQQRATAGLLITEASQVSPGGVGYPATPGIHSEAQVAGWREVVNAVHKENGHIFIQLWYCGRISHPSLLPDHATPVAPSALRPAGEAFTASGPQPFVEPRALDTGEIPTIVAQYRHAAEMARRAGFDGIEVHGANGYLIDQFLRDGTNRRDDRYGGSVENRMRLLNEVLDAVCQVWPAQRVAVRLTPENSFNDMSDSDPQSHFAYFIEQLSGRGLAYLHVLEGDMMSKRGSLDYRALRERFSGPYMANNGYDQARAEQAIRQGDADLVSFGVPFLANPDLVRRFREGLPLNEPDQATFYGGDATGYTDYPMHQ
ncbi:MAG: alkene reductase [Gammaproteobacteria bacterium]|nr:alkene reductase [Gammaproteobacteria bacterium]